MPTLDAIVSVRIPPPMPEAIGLTVLTNLEPVRLEATRRTEVTALRLNLLRAIGLDLVVRLFKVFLLVENLFFAICPSLLSLAFCFAERLAIMQTTQDIF